MAEQSKKNMLLLSGSKAAGNLPEGVKPGFLDWAEPWIKEFFAEPAQHTKPILFVPYARPDGMTEEAYFKWCSNAWQKWESRRAARRQKVLRKKR